MSLLTNPAFKKSDQALKEKLTKAKFLIKKKQFYIIQSLKPHKNALLHSTKKRMGPRMRRNPFCHTPHMWALSNEATLTKKSKFCLSTKKNQVILRQNLMNDKDLTRSRN